MKNNSKRLELLRAKSKKLKKDADALMNQTGFLQVLEELGSVHFVGSYALDLMMWEDVDMELKLPLSTDDRELFARKSHDVAMELTKKFTKMKSIKSVKLGINLNEIHKGLPDGIYIQVKFYIKEFKQTWKFDIWIIDPKEIEEDTKRVLAQKEEIQKVDRDLILQIKDTLITKAGRTPFQSGHFVYQAVLKEKLKTEKEILQYLEEHSIDVSHVRKNF